MTSALPLLGLLSEFFLSDLLSESFLLSDLFSALLSDLFSELFFLSDLLSEAFLLSDLPSALLPALFSALFSELFFLSDLLSEAFFLSDLPSALLPALFSALLSTLLPALFSALLFEDFFPDLLSEVSFLPDLLSFVFFLSDEGFLSVPFSVTAFFSDLSSTLVSIPASEKTGLRTVGVITLDKVLYHIAVILIGLSGITISSLTPYCFPFSTFQPAK